MEKNELDIYNKMVRQKYKFYKVWRILAIVFMCLTVLFAILYFASGEVITTEKNNNNDVQIVNEGQSYGTNNVTINN